MRVLSDQINDRQGKGHKFHFDSFQRNEIKVVLTERNHIRLILHVGTGVSTLVILVILRGHLGVPDTVSGPLIVPLNYLVILH